MTLQLSRYLQIASYQHHGSRLGNQDFDSPEDHIEIDLVFADSTYKPNCMYVVHVATRLNLVGQQ